MVTTSLEEAKLDQFLQWLKVNGVQLRGCNIKYSDSSKGFGIFSSDNVPEGQEILLVVPLDLAITPTRVLEDPFVGPECRAMLQEGQVDDRFLIMLFLTVERLRKNSSWKPYFDMLPTTFGNPLWFNDDELLELKGTTLHRATEMQKKNLKSMFDAKVKNLAEKLLALDGNPGSEVRYEDFLWANSIFWTRALTIPLPSSYVIPRAQDSAEHVSPENSANIENGKTLQMNNSASQESGIVPTNSQGETVWVEGLVPGIDFCNHDLKAAATWEVDGTGSMTGIPFSMYLQSAGIIPQGEKEISISYGDKGNEELLYLYGFVIKDNPDDYLMIHYPIEAMSDVPFSETKVQLLEAQKGELRCLLRRSLLNNGFFPKSSLSRGNNDKATGSQALNYSWSGHRKTPSYVDKLVFPDEFLSSLRTIAMKEAELYEVTSLLEELVGCEGERQPSETDVRAAIWEACGDSGALQLLVDLLNMKMTELEEGSGTEESDSELLLLSKEAANCSGMSRNRWASIIYRQGQKQLTRLFVNEAERALELALTEERN